MTFERMLRRRVMTGALLSTTLVAVIIAAPIVRFVTASLVHRQLELMDRFSAEAVGACEAAPGAWAPAGDGWRAWAYDDGFEPASPGAPAITPLMKLEATTLGRTLRVSPRDGVIVRPLAGRGPCAWMSYRWTAGPGVLEAFSAQAALLFAAAVIAVGAGGSLWFVRPIASSVDAIRAAAARVGTSAFAPPAVHPFFTQLAAVLSQANARVAQEQSAILQAQAMLEQHLDAVAHDLRTPLASLTLRLEALADEAPADPRLEEAIGDVAWLAQLVGNLHQATRLQRSARRRVEADLSELLTRVVGRFAVLGRRAGVEVSCNTPSRPIHARCDPDSVEQALANLIANAIEHRDAAGGHVAVTLDAHGARFALRVLDDGTALPPAVIPALQEAVAQQRTGGSRDGPLGLGLAIVGAVVETHGWTMSFEALDPGGLAVTIAGPTADAPSLQGSSTS